MVKELLDQRDTLVKSIVILNSEARFAETIGVKEQITVIDNLLLKLDKERTNENKPNNN